jgi:hypothetical protein
VTEKKARKRAIRARMAKTGERYTAARRHLVKPEPAVELPFSEDAVRRGTGKAWAEWFRILDEWGARERSHRDIARYVMDEHGVGGWWAQSVTVGYERARGLRAPHQTSKGFQVGVSKTVPVDVGTLFDAVVNPRRRSRWLKGGTLKLRTAKAPATARFDFGDGTSRVVFGFTPKGETKSTVALSHERLPDAAAVEEVRAFWKERLGRLAQTLTA